MLKVDLSLLSVLLDEGGNLFDPPGIHGTVSRHSDFEYWVSRVSRALSQEPGLKAEWLSLPTSVLVTSEGYDTSGRAWNLFVMALRVRMKWLGEKIQEGTAQAPKADPLEPLPPLAFDSIITDNEQAVEELSRRWDEAAACVVAGANLAAVIMYGSILEGVLSAVLESDPEAACRSKSAPKKDGRAKSFRDWTLADWINVAHEAGYISDDAKHFNVALRDYRNMVHPREALVRTSRDVDEHTARICREIVYKTVKEVERKQAAAGIPA